MTGRNFRITALSAVGMLGLATLGTPAFAGKMVTVPKIPPPPKVVAAVKPVPVPVTPPPAGPGRGKGSRPGTSRGNGSSPGTGRGKGALTPSQQ